METKKTESLPTRPPFTKYDGISITLDIDDFADEIDEYKELQEKVKALGFTDEQAKNITKGQADHQRRKLKPLEARMREIEKDHWRGFLFIVDLEKQNDR